VQCYKSLSAAALPFKPHSCHIASRENCRFALNHARENPDSTPGEDTLWVTDVTASTVRYTDLREAQTHFFFCYLRKRQATAAAAATAVTRLMSNLALPYQGALFERLMRRHCSGLAQQCFPVDAKRRLHLPRAEGRPRIGGGLTFH